MKIILILLVALSLVGCATDYKHYAKADEERSAATKHIEAARYKALGELGCNTTYVFDAAGKKIERQETKCDPETQRMAGMMLGIERLLGKQPGGLAPLEAPYSFKDVIRDVAALAVPLANAGVTAYQVRKGGDVAIAQSNNARGIAESTNNTMRGLATDGFAAATGIAANGFASATALGSRPQTTVTVNGNDNNVATDRSTATRTMTNTNDCPQTQTASGGNAAPGGAAGAGSGTTSATSGNGGNSAPAGTGAPATANQSTNCVAGK